MVLLFPAGPEGKAAVSAFDLSMAETAKAKIINVEVTAESMFTKVILNATYVTIWIALSATVIMYNKWILAYSGFPFPIALTLWHMVFCSLLAFALVRSK